MHTGSTLLVNLLYGLITPNEPVNGYWNIDDKIKLYTSCRLSPNLIGRESRSEKVYKPEDFEFSSSCCIYKSHNLDIDAIICKLSDDYRVYIISSERDELVINKKYKLYNNVLVFNYEELLETDTNTLKDIVDNAYDKLILFLPNEIKMIKSDGINRIRSMNKLYEEIKNNDFSYIDPFYELHGSHRGRKKSNNPVEGPDNKPVEGPDNKPVEGPDNKPVEGPDNKPVEGPDNKPVEGPDNKPVEGPDNSSKLNIQSLKIFHYKNRKYN